MWGLVQIIKMLAWSPWNCWAAAAKTHQNNKPTKCTKRPKIPPLLQRQQLQPKFFFAKKIPKPPKRDTKLIHLLWEHDPGKTYVRIRECRISLSLSNQGKREKKHTHIHIHTHTHTHKTLRLTPDHEIADCLLACLQVHLWFETVNLCS